MRLGDRSLVFGIPSHDPWGGNVWGPAGRVYGLGCRTCELDLLAGAVRSADGQVHGAVEGRVGGIAGHHQHLQEQASGGSSEARFMGTDGKAIGAASLQSSRGGGQASSTATAS
jgi:hypothetical protein